MGRQQHNRYNHFTTPTPAEVTITRRHHPLAGQKLEVLRGGRRQIVVRLPGSPPMLVPRARTDADGPGDLAEQASTVFTVDAIRELADLVTALQRRHRG